MVEKQNIEWKEIWKDDYLAWICGFANAQGGSLYLGLDDTGKATDLKNAAKLLEDLPNKIRDAMGIIVDINQLEQGGLDYLEIKVPPYPIAISCKGAYFYRSGSTNQRLTGPELESFILRRRGVTWDNMPLPSFHAKDISDDLVQRFKQWATKKGRIQQDVLDEPNNVLLERLHLTHAGYFTNAAMLLFSKDPEQWQLGAFTKIGYFQNDADLVYQDEIHGSLLDQIDQIIEVLHLKYMKAKITYEGMQRIEKYFVPESALREALLNALCHKDYSSGVPIQISVYEDQIYIANCGQLPENWTIENLMSKHTSKPFNPTIAHVFYLAGFIESWGRGIEKICSTCKADGVFAPEYTVNPGDIMIHFTAPEERIVRMNSLDRSKELGVGIESGIESGIEKSTEENLPTQLQQDILELLKEQPSITYAGIVQTLNVAERSVARNIQMLKTNGIITRIGSYKKGYWQINI